MFRYQNVIAALILGGAIVLSSILISNSIHSLDATLDSKPMAGSVNFPSQLSILSGNSTFDVRVRTDDKPLLVKQAP